MSGPGVIGIPTRDVMPTIREETDALNKNPPMNLKTRNGSDVVYRSMADIVDAATIHNLREKSELMYKRIENFVTRNTTTAMYSPVVSDVDARVNEGDFGAGHVGRYISLANKDRASGMMCHVPALITFSLLALFFGGFVHSYDAYVMLFLGLTAYMFGWAAFMAICAAFGMRNIRSAVGHDWNTQWNTFLEENPGIDEGMLHFVIFPNYQEDEEMMAQTISNIAQSALANKYMIVVLAMEAREGQAATDKSLRLINRFEHHFKDMIATFHPTNIPNEIKGKSSNTQWAYREVQRYYGNYVAKNAMSTSRSSSNHDPSKVFLTVADADSIHHPDYFTCLSLKALDKDVTKEERAWTMWQPPILLLRNYETVPQLVRTGAYGTFLFEVSGLAAIKFGVDHLCFSAYSLTLALANHPIVDGWDADVIAEDHHMYMKCLCASYWEQLFSAETGRSVTTTSKLRLEPIWLPVTSYLVEDSSGGAVASIYARYQQARRHMQGIAELAYILLQHFCITRESKTPMPWRAHCQLLHLGLKYTTITILNSVHAALCIATVLVGLCFTIQNFMEPQGFSESFHRFQDLREARPLYDTLVFVVQFYMPVLTLLIVSTNFMVVKDSVEGRYCPLYLQKLTTAPRDLAVCEKLKYRQMHRSGSGDTMNLESDLESPGQLMNNSASSSDLESGQQDTMSTQSGPSSATSSLGNTPRNARDGKPNPRSNVTQLDPTTEEKLVRSAEKLNSCSLITEEGEEDLFLTTRKLSPRQQVRLFLQIYTDLNLMGQITCIVYGTIPLLQTVVSLSRWGHKFDYIVAAKPEMHTAGLATGMRKATPKQSPAIPHAVGRQF